jgi:hypothetical protein
MIRWNLFFEVEKVEQLALIDRLATHHDRPRRWKLQENGIMIRRYSRGLFQQDRPNWDIGYVSSSIGCGTMPEHFIARAAFGQRLASVPRPSWFSTAA